MSTDHGQEAADATEEEVVLDPLTEEVQGLVFALLDEQIERRQLARLDELMRSDPEAREIYLKCVQMHVDLHAYFAQSAESADAKQESTAPLVVGLPINLPMGGIQRPTDTV
jgi:hypothetical protein